MGDVNNGSESCPIAAFLFVNNSETCLKQHLGRRESRLQRRNLVLSILNLISNTSFKRNLLATEKIRSISALLQASFTVIILKAIAPSVKIIQCQKELLILKFAAFCLLLSGWNTFSYKDRAPINPSSTLCTFYNA